MDGYAVAGEADSYTVVGETPAGAEPVATLQSGEAVRIFTGAPVPGQAVEMTWDGQEVWHSDPNEHVHHDVESELQEAMSETVVGEDNLDGEFLKLFSN